MHTGWQWTQEAGASGGIEFQSAQSEAWRMKGQKKYPPSTGQSLVRLSNGRLR